MRTITVLKYVLTAVILPLVTNANTDVQFSLVQKNLVIVETPSSVGSGFILTMQGTNYLVTNEHVLRGGHPLTARYLNGQYVDVAGVEVSDTRDLVRLPLRQQPLAEALNVTLDCTIGQRVWVFGNSDGGGVVTSINGSIVGIGPELIETDAAFVRGNSGSPIVDSNGHVVAVATYAIQNPAPSEWVKTGTRFDNVRRFGTTVTGTKWLRMSTEEYYQRSDYLADVATFCRDVHLLYYTTQFTDPTTGLPVYKLTKERERYRRYIDFPKFVESVATTFANKRKDNFRLATYTRSPYTGLDITPQQARELRDKMNLSEARREVKALARKMYDQIGATTTQRNWMSTRLTNEAKFWLSVYRDITLQE